MRNSLLTIMLSKPDFQSIENIFITMLVWLGVNIIIQARFVFSRLLLSCCCLHLCWHVHMQEWFEHQRIVDTTVFFYAFGCVLSCDGCVSRSWPCLVRLSFDCV